MLAKQDLIVRNAIMSKQSMTDGLTNLYNQSSFKDYYEKAFEYAKNGMSLHLALIDIDNFKSINDTYGHRVGDVILERVSLVIQENVTSSDIAARYGGEEFALLMFEQSFEQAYALVEQIRKKIARLVHPELEGAYITERGILLPYGAELLRSAYISYACLPSPRPVLDDIFSIGTCFFSWINSHSAENNKKLISAEPYRDPLVLTKTGQTLSHFLQQNVPGLM
ncbi:hypothetical protein G195_000734 [Phytophthora kernoviae 00238/432]|uniref:GGDEF domain-containing protein n=1 Tax=Phytophthora kernoviae 00238/432 TaxID=1284355 RepID=A0A8J4SPW2_9STRA|nr:hypothetical protein G195_000734 [Phytophthora kernoviae 00238/432]